MPSRSTPLSGLLTAALATFFALLILVPAQAEAVNVKRLTASVKVCPGQNRSGHSTKAQLRAMRCLINYARSHSGKRKFKSSSQLNRSAARKSSDILRCGFDHSACGRDFTFWMKKVGYGGGCWAGAENIAWGQGKLGNPRKIFISWLRSAGHRQNLLASGFNAFGVGMRNGKFLGYRGAQVWTTHFGRRC